MTRTQAYKLLRLWGDLNAIKRGPDAVAKRVVRRALWKLWPKPPRVL